MLMTLLTVHIGRLQQREKVASSDKRTVSWESTGGTKAKS